MNNFLKFNQLTRLFILCLFASTSSNVVYANTLTSILREMPDTTHEEVREVAEDIAANGGLAYGSNKADETKTFEGSYTPTADVSLAVLSDDGCSVFVNGTAVLSRKGTGQHLPDLNQSFHGAGSLSAGQTYNIKVEYSNTIYGGDSDIDGVTLFAYSIKRTPAIYLYTAPAYTDYGSLSTGGSSSTRVWAQVVDEAGRPFPNVNVQFSSNHEDGTQAGQITNSATTNSSGVAEATLTSGSNSDLAYVVAKATISDEEIEDWFLVGFTGSGQPSGGGGGLGAASAGTPPWYMQMWAIAIEEARAGMIVGGVVVKHLSNSSNWGIGSFANHHLYPQAFRDRFTTIFGSANPIDNYTIRVSQWAHQYFHRRGFGMRGGAWNAHWRRYFREFDRVNNAGLRPGDRGFRQPGSGDVVRYATELRKKYLVDDLRIRKYSDTSPE